MSSLPSDVEDELQNFLKLLIPSAIMLKNIIEPPIFNVKMKEVEDELQKLALNVRIKWVEQGNGYVKIGSAVKKSDQILVVKVEQVE